MIDADVDAHARELVVEVLGRFVARIGEEEELLPVRFEPFDEFLGAGEQTVPMVDDAVHVADEAAFAAKLFHTVLFLVVVRYAFVPLLPYTQNISGMCELPRGGALFP